MSTEWSKTRRTRSLLPYAEPFGFAGRAVDGNDALDVYHSARWARSTALEGKPVFLDCMTFRTGLYSSHFGEVRPGVEADLAKAEQRDPLKRMADWLIAHASAAADDIERLRRAEDERLEQIFMKVLGEVNQM
jgi:TPP-dependent pyruvate/acetoin dehydrogenase alpha subunit